MKKFFQLVLLIVLILLIILFYFIYFPKNTSSFKIKTNIEKDGQITKEEQNNLIKNLRYDVNFDNDTKYSISSDLSELVYDGNIEKVVMKKVIAILKNQNEEPLIITSNNAIYNNSNYNTLFDTNVKIEYITHTILSEKLDLNFNKNMIKIYDNVSYEGLNGVIKTDVVTIDLTTKNIEIFMENLDEKVQIMSK